MLAVASSSLRAGRRAAIVIGGQRQAAVHVVRKSGTRNIQQSVAQTDRVRDVELFVIKKSNN